MRRALFVLTNVSRLEGTSIPAGFDVRETAGVWEALTNEGFDISFASPSGGVCRPIVPTNVDSSARAFMSSSDWVRATQSSDRLADVDSGRFDVLYLVGGHGAMVDFWPNADVEDAVRSAFDSGRVVAAICHGAAGILGARADGSAHVVGRSVTAFSDAEEAARGLLGVVPYSLEQELISRGATFHAAPDRTSNVVVDEQLITAQNPYSVDEFAHQILQRARVEEEEGK